MRSKAIPSFVGVSVMFAVPAIVGVYFHDRPGLHAILNRSVVGGSDTFFRWLTHLGDGVVPTLIACALLFMGTWRSFLLVAISSSLGALITQGLKRQVFAGCDRPAEYLADMPGLYLVDGVELHHHFSFPSGHATAAFSLCMALAILVNRSGAAALLAVAASLIAFSRVYLSQHFTEDILAGAAIGISACTITYFLIYRTELSQRPWMDRRPLVRPGGS